MGLFSRDIETLHDLFVHTLQDIYYAENQITKALLKMIDRATDASLRARFATLEEEHATDEKLSGLAETFANASAERVAVI